MTRKDYNALADAFAVAIFEMRLRGGMPTGSPDHTALMVIGTLRNRVEDALLRDNPAFSRQRFRDRIEATYDRLIKPIS